jgi:hypothetical protein
MEESVINLGEIILGGMSLCKELDDKSVKTFRQAVNYKDKSPNEDNNPQLPDVQTDTTVETPSTMTPSRATDTELTLPFLANDPNLPKSLRAQLNNLEDKENQQLTLQWA